MHVVQLPDQASGVHLPELYLPAPAWFTAPQGQGFALGTERERINAVTDRRGGVSRPNDSFKRPLWLEIPANSDAVTAGRNQRVLTWKRQGTSWHVMSVE